MTKFLPQCLWPRRMALLLPMLLATLPMGAAAQGTGPYDNSSLDGPYSAHDLFALRNGAGATATGIRRFEDGQQISFLTFASETPLSYAVQPDGVFRIFKPGGFDSGPTGSVALQGAMAVYQRSADPGADGQVPSGYAALRLSLARGSGLNNAAFQGDYHYAALLFTGSQWRNVVGRATANGAGQFTLLREGTTGSGPYVVSGNGEVALGSAPRGAATLDASGGILLQTVDTLAGRDPLFPAGAQGLALYLRTQTNATARDLRGRYRVHRLTVAAGGSVAIATGEIHAGGAGVFFGNLGDSDYSGRIEVDDNGQFNIQSDASRVGYLGMDADVAVLLPPTATVSMGAGTASLEIWVRTAGGAPLPRDRDGDGLSDAEEAALDTSPDNPDSDGDGLIDGIDPQPLEPDNRFTARLAPNEVVLSEESLSSFYVDLSLNSSLFPFFDWSISTLAPWIDPRARSGTGDASLRFEVDPATFTAANSPYTADFRITAPDMQALPPLRLTIVVEQGLDPASLTPAELAFLAVEDGGPPPMQRVQLNTAGPWQATASAPWLLLSPASGTGNAMLNVSVEPAGLAAAASPFEAEWRITTNRPDTPAAVGTARLTVLAPRPPGSAYPVAAGGDLQYSPALAVGAPGGELAFAWLEGGVLHGALLDPLGGPLLGRTPLSVPALGVASHPMVVADQARSTVWFLWEQQFGEDLRTGIQARTLNLATRLFGNPFGFAAAEGAMNQPRATAAPDLDSVLVAYVLRDPGRAEIRLLRYSLATRAVLWDTLVAVTPETGFAPDLAHDPATGRVAVAWTEERIAEGDVFGRLHWRVLNAASGDPAGSMQIWPGTDRFVHAGVRAQWNPDADAFQLLFVAKPTVGASGGELLRQSLGPDGTPRGTALPLAAGAALSGHSGAVATASLQALPVWTDAVAGDRGSYRRTTPNEFFLGDVLRLPFAGGGQFAPEAVYSSTRNEFALAWQEAGVVPAQIYAMRLGGGSPDEDGDGLPNAWELQYGLNPFSAASDDGADGDPDGDGLTNGQEFRLGTHPRQPDSDGDGLWDGQEDANQNGAVDPGETSPLLADSDGDGADDLAERLLGTDGTSATERPASGLFRVAYGGFPPGQPATLRLHVHAAEAGAYQVALNPAPGVAWNPPAGWSAPAPPALNLPTGSSVVALEITAQEFSKVPGDFRFVLAGPGVVHDTLTARLVPTAPPVAEPPDFDALALRHAPVLRMHRDAYYPPSSIETTLALAEFRPRPGIALPGTPGVLDLMQSPQAESVIALPSDSLDGLRAAFATLPPVQPVVYYAVRALPLPEPLPETPVPAFALQYYVHFFADEWGRERLGGHRHAGDWEMVQVLLDNTLAPVGVTATQQWQMARDGAVPGGAALPWAAVERHGEAHPVLYVGLGGNSLYFQPGATRYAQGFEEHDGLGPWYLPESDDATTTYPNATPFALRPLGQPGAPDAPAWLTFAGRWGQPDFPQDENDLPTPASRSGPEGPPFLSTADTASLWLNPVSWAGTLPPPPPVDSTTVRGILPAELAGATVALLDARGRIFRATSDTASGAFALLVPEQHYTLAVVDRDALGTERVRAGALFPTNTPSRNLFPTLPLDTDLGVLALVDGLLSGSGVYARSDADGDGTPDALDPDQDGDGRANPVDDDALGDGWADAYLAQDPDDNGIPRYYDDASAQPPVGPGGPDLDGDGIPDAVDLDWDNDGFPNDDEQRLGTNPRVYFDFPGQRVGDLDQDDDFDAVDLQRLVNIALRRDPYTPLSDLDGDRRCGAADVQALLNRMLGR